MVLYYTEIYVHPRVIKIFGPLEDAMHDRLLTRLEVEKRCRIARTTIYRKMREGTFPTPLKIGARAVRWSESEIEAWLASRPRATGERPVASG